MNEHNLSASKKDTLTLADLIQELVQTPEQVQTFLRTGWINRIMLQLVSARIEAGLTQAELGERMGKQQSAIARLERGDDIKLSTLFDYLAALDRLPVGQIATVPEEQAIARLKLAADSPKQGQPTGDLHPTASIAAD